MAYSDTVSLTRFNVLNVIETAYRRCRLPAQAITGEMQAIAKAALYLLLSRIPNPRNLTWCIERTILPMTQGQPVVQLPLGTVNVQNVNYRSMGVVTPTVETNDATTYTLTFGSDVTIATVGAFYDDTTGTVNVQTSPDGVSWTTVATMVGGAADEIEWVDIVPAVVTPYLRLQNGTALNVSAVVCGNNPSEIPMGQLNKDTYVAQNNKIFEGRPTTYYTQRDIPRPVLNLWPAPNSTAETQAQLVVWRQRHIMDVGTYRDDLEVPQRWLDAVCWLLAAAVAYETPAVDAALIPVLETKAEAAKMEAYDGDSDGAPTMIQPMISGYTR